MADFQTSSLNSAPKPKWRILGTKGSIVADWGDSITVNVEHQGHIATYKQNNVKGEWSQYYQNIYDHLANGAELIVKPEESRRTIAVMEAAERSSKSGKTETPAYS
jgi:predicted dehydrogenase